MEFFELYFEVLYSAGRNAHVIGAAVIVVGDDCGGGFVGLVCRFIASASDGQPSKEGLHEYGKEEGGQCVSLECTSEDGEWGSIAV